MYLNIEVINKNDSSFLRNMENTCLKPVRYLWGDQGRTIEILNNEIVKDAPSFERRTYLGTALAIAALVPGIILGLLAKALNSLKVSYANDMALVKRFLQAEIHLPAAPANISLDHYHADFCLKMNALYNQIKADERIWQDANFIQECSLVMEDGYAYMELYFRQLATECNHDAKLITEQMILQPQNRGVPGQDYCHTFFLFSTLYHHVRGCSTQLNRDEWGDAMGIGADEPMPVRQKDLLKEEDQEPYFNPTKPQYRWRQLYNAFCKLVDKNGVRRLLEKPRGGDQRFSNWSRPDTHKVRAYYAPDTQPT